MKIEFMRAFTPSCMEDLTCWMCGSRFVAKAVLIYGDPHSEELCELCFRSCCGRQKLSNIPEDWPTWAEYFDLCEQYPEPVFKDGEEGERAENLGLHDDFEKLAYFLL